MGQVEGMRALWAQLAVLASVSVSHMSMPNHWMPYSLVGRANNWTLQYTLFISKCSFALRFYKISWMTLSGHSYMSLLSPFFFLNEGRLTRLNELQRFLER